MKKNKEMERADRWFSRYIRLTYSFGNGADLYCVCYTCGNIKRIKDIDNGHFITRENKSTRYNVDNCRPQCKKCNYYREGMKHVFERKLIQEIGKDRVALLKIERNKVSKMGEFEFSHIADRYRLEVRLIEELLGIKLW